MTELEKRLRELALQAHGDNPCTDLPLSVHELELVCIAAARIGAEIEREACDRLVGTCKRTGWTSVDKAITWCQRAIRARGGK